MISPSPSDTPPISISVGIIVGLLASCVQSLGLTIQRKSHVINQLRPEVEQRGEHRRPLWLLGFGIFISANLLGSLFQIASLPVVILAPLGAVSLLWNALFARLLLGDVFSPFMILGTLEIAGGAVLIAIYGIVPEPTHSLENLLILFRRKAFIAYFSLLGATVVIALAVTHIAEFSLRYRLVTPEDTPPKTPQRGLSPPPSLAQPTIDATESTPLLDPKPTDSTMSTQSAMARTRLILAVSYASVSGILSGMCLLFAKSGVELLILTAKGDNQFWRWEAWALIVGLVVFAVLQLWYLHKSLILADPTIVCPLAFCFYNLSSIMNGLVYYDQFGALTNLHLFLVVLGIIILLAGVWGISIWSGGAEPIAWQEDDEVSICEGPEAVGVRATERPGLPRRRNVSWPTSPPADLPPRSTSSVFPGLSPTRPLRHRHRRYTSLLGSESQGGATMSGLSIGLSPVSPGFALRPARRRSMNRSLASLADEVMVRRAVSEADADREVEAGREGTRRKARWKSVWNAWSRRRQGDM